jgi:D-xylose transport system substrate-binding protein
MRTTWLAAAAACAALGLAACGGSDDNSGASGGSTSAGGGGGGGGGKKIALLLPESKTTRYEQHDRPTFEAKVKELCPDCEFLYANAEQDATKQQTQAESMITKGANVLVLDAVDTKAAVATVNLARSKNIPVIAYDRLITGAPIDYSVSFDNVRQGRIQAQTLLDKLGPGAKGKSIIMINGAPTDPSAGDYKKGAHQAFDPSGVKIAKEFDTPDWSPDKAQREMDQAITAVGKDGFVGVYSANDGMASGAIASMQGAGIDPRKVPVSGGDSEVAAIQRLLDGTQYSTIYLTIKKQAEVSAELAVAAAQGKPAPAGLVNTKVDNESGQVPSVLLSPVPVTRDTIQSTVIKDGFLKVSDVCDAKHAKACEDAGVK